MPVSSHSGSCDGEERIQQLEEKLERLRVTFEGAQAEEKAVKVRMEEAAGAIDSAEANVQATIASVDQYSATKANSVAEVAKARSATEDANQIVEAARKRHRQLGGDGGSVDVDVSDPLNTPRGSATEACASALRKISDRDLSEVRRLPNPPTLARRSLELVQAMMACAEGEADELPGGASEPVQWSELQKMLARDDFIRRVLGIQPLTLSLRPKLLAALEDKWPSLKDGAGKENAAPSGKENGKAAWQKATAKARAESRTSNKLRAAVAAAAAAEKGASGAEAPAAEEPQMTAENVEYASRPCGAIFRFCAGCVAAARDLAAERLAAQAALDEAVRVLVGTQQALAATQAFHRSLDEEAARREAAMRKAEGDLEMACDKRLDEKVSSIHVSPKPLFAVALALALMLHPHRLHPPTHRCLGLMAMASWSCAHWFVLIALCSFYPDDSTRMILPGCTCVPALTLQRLLGVPLCSRSLSPDVQVNHTHATRDLEEARKAYEAALRQFNAESEAWEGRRAENERRSKERAARDEADQLRRQQQIEAEIKSRNQRLVWIRDHELTTECHLPIEFTEVGSPALPAAASALLAKVARELQQCGALKLHIAGHVQEDEDPKIASQRAQAVGGALIALGVLPLRLRAKGYGATVCLSRAAKTALRLKSQRRVTLHALSEVCTHEPVGFEAKEKALSDAAQTLLSELATLLEQQPQMRLSVEAHTDAIGDAMENAHLSMARAMSVVSFLEGRGVAASRLTPHGFGAAFPCEDNATPAGRKRNRRVEFLVIPDVTTATVNAAAIAPTAPAAAPAAAPPPQRASVLEQALRASVTSASGD